QTSAERPELPTAAHEANSAPGTGSMATAFIHSGQPSLPKTIAAPPIIPAASAQNVTPASEPARSVPLTNLASATSQSTKVVEVSLPSRPDAPVKIQKSAPAAEETNADGPSSIPVPPALVSSHGSATVPSFEMRLGTFWLVRIGVVMVLTGLVFFGNLAYHNYISKLGPGGKVCLLYLTSGLLLAAGWWWQRKAVKEALRNYAQVLFAGGLGALYFTTYAAHHLERLRVIQNAWLDGLLLLMCAGFMVWAAERKRSEVLAFFAVGLAYYSSIITRVGYFTLLSNLVLSIAAVFFLIRNRW